MDLPSEVINGDEVLYKVLSEDRLDTIRFMLSSVDSEIFVRQMDASIRFEKIGYMLIDGSWIPKTYSSTLHKFNLVPMQELMLEFLEALSCLGSGRSMSKKYVKVTEDGVVHFFIPMVARKGSIKKYPTQYTLKNPESLAQLLKQLKRAINEFNDHLVSCSLKASQLAYI